MKREHVLLAALAVLALAGSAGLYRFLRSEEDRVRDVIHGAAQAAVRRDAAGVVARLDTEFTGPQGVKLPLATDYLRYALDGLYVQVEVNVAPPDFPVQLRDDETRATARFTLTARGQTREGAWVDLVRHWKTAPQWSVELVQRDGTWRMLTIQAPL